MKGRTERDKGITREEYQRAYEQHRHRMNDTRYHQMDYYYRLWAYEQHYRDFKDARYQRRLAREERRRATR